MFFKIIVSTRLTWAHNQYGYGTSHTKFQVTRLCDRGAPALHSFCQALHKIKFHFGLKLKIQSLLAFLNPKIQFCQFWDLDVVFIQQFNRSSNRPISGSCFFWIKPTLLAQNSKKRVFLNSRWSESLVFWISAQSDSFEILIIDFYLVLGQRYEQPAHRGHAT